MRTIVSSDIGGSHINWYCDDDEQSHIVQESDDVEGTTLYVAFVVSRKEARAAYTQRMNDYFDSSF